MIGARTFRSVVAGLAVAAVGLLGACTPDDQETRTLDVQGEQTRAQLPPDVVEALDSGTVAYREHRFEDALVHYQRAAELAPDQPAGWFGVSMAQEALGKLEAADSALERVKGLAPGATILHPDDTATAGGGGGEVP